jgi:hypothetical protein
VTAQQPRSLYGFHDPGGEQLLIDAGKSGWVLVIETIGHNARSTRGRSYADLADKGLGVIACLVNGFNPDGTLPAPEHYEDFARRCAFFAKNSTGCHIWVIGNEMNHSQARPHGEPITPDLYARCYRTCRQAIHESAGADHQVLLGAVAPYNVETKYPGNEMGDWVSYLSDVLERVGDECDGVALHAYTWGSDPDLITSDEPMDPPYDHRHKQFRVYRDFMEAIPEGQRHLPVYITEANQGGAGVPWKNSDDGWIPRAYAEIDEWNRGGGQQIRCLLLHRWSTADPSAISNKDKVIADFQAALAHDYRWGNPVEELPDVGQDVQAMILELREQVSTLAERVEGLEEQFARHLSSQPVLVDRPRIEYAVESLPRHATDRYDTRSLDQITHIVVHHSATPAKVTAEQMARYHVNDLDWPGIGYHFVIATDGTVQQGNELTSISYHARQANRYSVGICFVGNFKEVVPPEAQLASGGHLIAWLLQEMDLPLGRVGGHKEHVPTTSCPGDQWDSGQMWRDLLLARIKGWSTPAD